MANSERNVDGSVTRETEQVHSKDDSTLNSEMNGDLTAKDAEEEPVFVKPTFAQKAKRHCARFWWLHLIIFCSCFLIIALCLVYVGMPKIAQDGVKDSSLEFTQLDFLEPAPDKITLTQRGILYSPSRYTPTLDAFNASTYLVLNGTLGAEPFFSLPMPKIHARHPQSNFSVEAHPVAIENLDGVTAYTTAVLSDEYVTVELHGRTKLHLGSLPDVTINYKERITSKALNGLKGFNVTDARIDLTAKAGEVNLRANAYIPNPSIMTIALGNVTLSLATAKAGVIGNATILNMTVRPGDNSFPLAGIISQPLVVSSLNSTGFVEMLITGHESVYNGQHLVYYEKALSVNQLTLQMNVLQILKDSAAA